MDYEDLVAVLLEFGSCEGDPGFSHAADFGGDGCVDISDLARLLAEFGT